MMRESMNLHHGDCLDVLRTMPANSVDSIVTDPPYGLSFMNKKWDYDVPSEGIWRECLRVLKPGGHLLAFAGTRTQHRMAVRIEDAGFEIRDMIAWVYGSGFPKSLDVGKAIDKRGGSHAEFAAFKDDVKAAMSYNGVSRKQIEAALGNFMLSHYLTAASQPAVPNLRDYLIIRDTVGLGGKWDLQFRAEAEREVVEERKATDRRGDGTVVGLGHSGNADITAPATDAAKKWQGWGTALKPALEPITVARKPLSGTVAATVLKHGTGALNVDGCRVGDKVRHAAFTSLAPCKGNRLGAADTAEARRGTQGDPKGYTGRWPANLIHDGSDEVLAGFPQTTSGSMKAGTCRAAQDSPGSVCYGTYGGNATDSDTYADSGSAARFFYCAKASKRDRDEGCEGLVAGRGGALNMRTDSHSQANGMDTGPRRNHHPTVKPTDLMRYLCRLVTPPGGIVLDPFMGSGSTGKAALLEGFRFIGIERSAEYLEIAKARIQHPTNPNFVRKPEPVK